MMDLSEATALQKPLSAVIKEFCSSMHNMSVCTEFFQVFLQLQVNIIIPNCISKVLNGTSSSSSSM